MGLGGPRRRLARRKIKVDAFQRIFCLERTQAANFNGVHGPFTHTVWYNDPDCTFCQRRYD